MQHPLSQPYAQGMNTRLPGPSLAAMLSGRSLYGHNPMDQQRQFGALARLLATGVIR